MTQKDQMLNRGLEVWKPVISAVNGYCLGGGMTLMLATDLRLAAPHATFSLAEVKRGVIPGNGGTQRVLKQLPYPIAMEMLLTGDAIDAETAARWGLVNRVVPQADAAGDGPGAGAARLPPMRRWRCRRPRSWRCAARHGRWRGTAAGAAGQPPADAETDDAKEGPAAFAEKRPPKFKGA